jgi:hypothetical protein
MTQTAPQMPPARRRPIPGMSAVASDRPPPNPEPETSTTEHASRRAAATRVAVAGEEKRPARTTRRRAARSAAEAQADADADRSGARERRPAVGYATTRLVNFRLPVDLRDRFKQLVHNAEQKHPRLRHPSLTELLIALLEEGPGWHLSGAGVA